MSPTDILDPEPDDSDREIKKVLMARLLEHWGTTSEDTDGVWTADHVIDGFMEEARGLGIDLSGVLERKPAPPQAMTGGFDQSMITVYPSTTTSSSGTFTVTAGVGGMGGAQHGFGPIEVGTGNNASTHTDVPRDVCERCGTDIWLSINDRWFHDEVRVGGWDHAARPADTPLAPEPEVGPAITTKVEHVIHPHATIADLRAWLEVAEFLELPTDEQIGTTLRIVEYISIPPTESSSDTN